MRLQSTRTVLLSLLIPLALSFARPAGAQAPPAPPPAAPAAAAGDEEGIDVNYNGVDLVNILEDLARETGYRFMYDDNLKKAKVYLISERKIPVEAYFPAVESMLQMNGLALVEIPLKETKPGEAPVKMFKVFPVANIVKQPLQVTGGRPEDVPPEEQMITQIIPLSYVDAREVQVVLQPLITDGRSLMPIGDVIVVTDYALNVRRIMEIVKLMDKKKPDVVIEVVKLVYAYAGDIATQVAALTQQLIQSGTIRPRTGAGGQPQQEPLQMVPDLRTNSLVILAMPDRIDQIKDLIARLDVPETNPQRSIHIYQLKHSDAEKMAGILNNIYAGIGTTGPTSSSVPAASTQPGATPTPVPVARPSTSTGMGPGGRTANPIFVADKTNNAIIVVADQKTYDELVDVIARLDVRRPQVLLECAIVEVTGNDSLSLGAEFVTVDGAADALRGFGGSQFGLSQLFDTDGDNIPDVKVPIGFGSGLIAGLTKEKAGRIPAILAALKTRSNVNVLSIPEVTTNDNVKATIKSQNQRPTGTQTIGAGGQQTFSFNNFVDAGISLDITPHISENNYLRLEIAQEISRFGDTSSIQAGLPPPRSTRNISATVTVPNEFTVVLGGLVVDNEDRSETGLPLFMDIPLLGHLFKRQSRGTEKTTYYVFITPHILSDEAFGDYARLSRERHGRFYDATLGRWVGPLDLEDPGGPRSLDIIHYESPFKGEDKKETDKKK
ncbi:MAG: type II secretion system secretin GspD [Planctomycetes bacterium]|nr:type II secretion system secretin GspD [Planctomycetota bacterium]